MKRSLLACIALLFTCLAPQASQAALATCVTNMQIALAGPYYGGQFRSVITYNTNATTGPNFKRSGAVMFTPDAGKPITEAYLLTYVPESKATASSMPSLAGLPACNAATFVRTVDSSGVDMASANAAYNQTHKTCPANSTLDAYGSCNCNTGFIRTASGTCETRAVCNLGTIDSNNNCTCPAGSTLQGTAKNGTCAMTCNGGTLTTTSNYSSCVCHNGQTLINGTCSCSADQMLVGGSCVKKTVCGANAAPNASNQCVCNAGYTLIGGSCVTPVTCPANATANASNQCICKSGYTMSGGMCIVNSNGGTSGTGTGGTGTTTGGGTGTTTGMTAAQRQACLNTAMASLNSSLAACGAQYGKSHNADQYTACSSMAGDVWSAKAALCK